MNKHQENEGLLKDVLGEGPFASRREALLAGTLRHVRKRRRIRHARQMAYIVAFAVLVGAGVLNLRRPQRAETRFAPTKAYLLVQTQPLPSATLVESKGLPPASIVNTVRMAGVLTTAASKVQIQVVNDDALLAMAAPNPAVLVRHDGKAELVFVNSHQESAE